MWLQRVTSSWNKEEQRFQTSNLKADIYYDYAKSHPMVSVDQKRKKGRKNLNCSNFLFWFSFFFLLLCFSTTYWMIHHHYLFNTQQIGVAPNTMDVCEFYINSIGFTKKTLQTWHRVILVGLKVISSIHTNH